MFKKIDKNANRVKRHLRIRKNLQELLKNQDYAYSSLILTSMHN